MGAWGTGIFDDDVAADVQTTWTQLLKDGLSPREATTAVREKFGSDDPIVLLALAATQWAWGRLDGDIKAHALRILREGTALEGWSGDPGRVKALRVLEEKLRSEPPPPRAVKTVVVPQDWQPGELLAWKVMDGRVALLRVVGCNPSYGKSAAPTCELLDWYDVGMPAKKELRALGLRATTRPDKGLDPKHRAHPLFTLGVFRAGEYPHRRLRRLNVRTELPRSVSEGSVGVHWDDFDEFLALRFSIGWTAGTVVALRAKSGALFLLSVTQVRRASSESLEVFVDVLDWRRKGLPDAQDISSLKVMKSRKYPEWWMGLIAIGKVKNPERLSVVGWRGSPPPAGSRRDVFIAWDELAELLDAKSPLL
jgi:hypothetical protein